MRRRLSEKTEPTPVAHPEPELELIAPFHQPATRTAPRIDEHVHEWGEVGRDRGVAAYQCIVPGCGALSSGPPGTGRVRGPRRQMAQGRGGF